MIKSNFDDLRRRKAYREHRNLPLRVIARETGLSLGAINRLKNERFERVYLSTLEKLCTYFAVATLSELIEFVPDAPGRKGEGR